MQPIPTPPDPEQAGRLSRLRARVTQAGTEAGMTTAEYAVGTVAACGFGGVLYKVVTSDSVLRALGALLAKALRVSF